MKQNSPKWSPSSAMFLGKESTNFGALSNSPKIEAESIWNKQTCSIICIEFFYISIESNIESQKKLLSSKKRCRCSTCNNRFFARALPGKSSREKKRSKWRSLWLWVLLFLQKLLILKCEKNFRFDLLLSFEIEILTR